MEESAQRPLNLSVVDQLYRPQHVVAGWELQSFMKNCCHPGSLETLESENQKDSVGPLGFSKQFHDIILSMAQHLTLTDLNLFSSALG